MEVVQGVGVGVVGWEGKADDDVVVAVLSDDGYCQVGVALVVDDGGNLEEVDDDLVPMKVC